MEEQSRNRTNNCIVEIEGERKILQDWIDETGSYSRAIKKEEKLYQYINFDYPKRERNIQIAFLKGNRISRKSVREIGRFFI